MKRSKIDIYLDPKEKEILKEYLKHTHSYRRASELASTIMKMHGKDENVSSVTIKSWIEREHPEIREQVEVEKGMGKHAEKENQPQYDPKDLLTSVNRRKA
jgi:uncharacterized protein YjcR